MIILTLTLARIIEAFRDAEAFEKPTESRSFWWHALKWPQYAAWFVSGWLPLDLWVVVGLAVAWLAFEVSLKLFRRWM